jgi:hypothetical protein
MHFAHNQAISLETAQSLGEHFLGDAANGAAQFRVALSSVGQNLDDEGGPFIRDPIENHSRRALRFQDRGGRRFHPAFSGANTTDASGE